MTLVQNNLFRASIVCNTEARVCTLTYRSLCGGTALKYRIPRFFILCSGISNLGFA